MTMPRAEKRSSPMGVASISFRSEGPFYHNFARRTSDLLEAIAKGSSMPETTWGGIGHHVRREQVSNQLEVTFSGLKIAL